MTLLATVRQGYTLLIICICHMSIHIYDRNTFGKVLSNSLVEGRMVANLEDEALQPSPSFELFQERSMFLFDLKKKP